MYSDVVMFQSRGRVFDRSDNSGDGGSDWGAKGFNLAVEFLIVRTQTKALTVAVKGRFNLAVEFFDRSDLPRPLDRYRNPGVSISRSSF